MECQGLQRTQTKNNATLVILFKSSNYVALRDVDLFAKEFKVGVLMSHIRIMKVNTCLGFLI
jgi:hypothetical protein